MDGHIAGIHSFFTLLALHMYSLVAIIAALMLVWLMAKAYDFQ